MSELEPKPNNRASSFAMELLNYYDEFTEFNEDCAFLCDAFAAIAASSENLDRYSINGFERNAFRLKRRAVELKEKLKAIREMGLEK